MRVIKYINTFAISLPFLVAFAYVKYGFDAIIVSLYSTMVTGFIQVVLGIILFIHNPVNKFIQAYSSAVLLFFALWYFNVCFYYLDFLTSFLVPTPLILAIYLSILIYRRKHL